MLANCREEKLKETCGFVIELARRKLLSYDVHIETRPGSFNLLTLLAVADVRLCLEYEPRNSALVLEQTADLVSHHMRLVYSVSKHRNYFRSGYSSEPILAEVSVDFPLLILRLNNVSMLNASTY